MKTLGIIGGLGPDTSAMFYLELISRCFIKNQVQRPPILLWNVPIHYAVEAELILKGSGEEKYLPFLIEAAQILEKGGADFIVIPCNTVHVFIEEIRKSVSIPVLSIVEETTKKIVQKKLSRVGFLSTELTVKKKIYENIFCKNNIEFLSPSHSSQQNLNIIIQKILMNTVTNKEMKKMEVIIQELLKNDVKSIVLACTDLQHIVNTSSNYEILDSMKILAESSVNILLENTQDEAFSI